MANLHSLEHSSSWRRADRAEELVGCAGLARRHAVEHRRCPASPRADPPLILGPVALQVGDGVEGGEGARGVLQVEGLGSASEFRATLVRRHGLATALRALTIRLSGAWQAIETVLVTLTSIAATLVVLANGVSGIERTILLLSLGQAVTLFFPSMIQGLLKLDWRQVPGSPTRSDMRRIERIGRRD